MSALIVVIASGASCPSLRASTARATISPVGAHIGFCAVALSGSVLRAAINIRRMAVSPFRLWTYLGQITRPVSAFSRGISPRRDPSHRRLDLVDQRPGHRAKDHDPPVLIPHARNRPGHMRHLGAGDMATLEHLIAQIKRAEPH